MADRASYVGVPEIFELNAACQLINKAFDDFGCYHVGSSLDRRDYRDVDVRYIMSDEKFSALFGEEMPILMCPKDKAHTFEPNRSFCHCGERLKIKQHFWRFEINPLWSLMSITISNWLRLRTGLPIDFQIQPQTYANEKFDGRRNPLGLFIKS